MQRIAFLGAIAVLLAGLIIAGARLPAQLRSTLVAEADDRYWPIFQLETEIANLAVVLVEQSVRPVPDSAAIRFRTEIALSRFPLVYRPYADTDGELAVLLQEVRAYEAELTAMADGRAPLTQAEIEALLHRTAEFRPDIRRLSVLAVNLRAQATAEDRQDLASTFILLAIATLAFIVLLIVALIYLQHLLAAARRKDAEISETTDRLASTVSASLDGIIIADDAGRIVEFNPAASTIFGWRREDILGQSMDQTIVPPQHREAHGAGMRRYLDTQVAHVIDAGRIELSALRKTGEEFPIELNITSTRRDGREYFIGYIRDISRQKISEQQLIDARDSAEQADRAKSRFLTVMSHEMRTPLNGILGVLDLLMKTSLQPQQARYVQVAAASSEILLESVNEALDITRIEAGVMSLTPERFSLRATVRRVADVLRTLAAEKGLTLDVTIDRSMDQEFVADSGRINQILTNLIGNAIKFTETGGIRVDVSGIHGPEETAATIVVQDTGRGIPRGMLDTIFEDFIALARPDGRQSRSDGLGLSIARKMARLMGGDLTAESEPGKGSVFTLKIPLHRTNEAPPARPVSRVLPVADAKSVLIVEDNAVNRSVLNDMLVGLGHRVTEAGDGLAALKTAAADRFDLIVMDISMPFMDGIEATRRIRSDPGPNQDTYILGLTAHGREEFRNRAKAAGMDGFCTKPIRLAELERALSVEVETEDSNEVTTRLIADDVLAELRRALGDAKVRATADQFFAELGDLLQSLSHDPGKVDAATVPAAIHKMRGAAVMLGFDALDAALAQLGDAAKSETDVKTEQALAAVLRTVDASRDAFLAKTSP